MKTVLNEVLASPRMGTWYYCSGSDFIWDSEQFVDFLLAESAMKIFIPAWEAKIMKLDIDKISNISKEHIELVDKNKKIYSNIKSIVTDISNGLDWSKKNDNEIGYSLNRLFEFIYHLHLSNDYLVDCDISRPDFLIENLSELTEIAIDKEVISLLNEMKGVLNLYSATELDCNISIAPMNQKVNRRLKDILVDTSFLQISKHRNEIANTGDVKLFPKIKLLTRKLSMKKLYRKFIGLAKLPIAIISPENRKSIEKVGDTLFDNRNFSPPIVDLTKIAEIGFCGGEWTDSGPISEMGYPENVYDNLTGDFLWWENCQKNE